MTIDPTQSSGGAGQIPPALAGEAPSGSFETGGGWDSYEKWMGKANFEQFQKNLCQGIVQQIGKDKEKEHKAAQELQRAEKGEDMYDDT